jgi:hypothetical protein
MKHRINNKMLITILENFTGISTVCFAYYNSDQIPMRSRGRNVETIKSNQEAKKGAC